VTDHRDGEKKTLRAALRHRLATVDDAERKKRSAAACERLVAEPEFRRAGAVMLFLPLRDEIDATAIALRAWQDGKIVTVPLIGAEQRHMIPVEIRSLTEPMDTDRLGVRTPTDRRPIPIAMIDLLIVPGLGFDRTGRRIGRGGGFYDRFMAQPDFGAATCGLALDEQLVDRVPTAGHDVSVDMLVTDRRLLRFDTADQPPD